MNRTLLEAALAYAGQTYSVGDVEAEVENGTAQLWEGPNSLVVTTIDEQPRKKILHFFLAAGIQAELEAMTPGILEWGKEQGCVQARMMGRKGWTKSFLPRTGWTVLDVVVMEKDI